MYVESSEDANYVSISYHQNASFVWFIKKINKKLTVCSAWKYKIKSVGTNFEYKMLKFSSL